MYNLMVCVVSSFIMVQKAQVVNGDNADFVSATEKTFLHSCELLIV